MAKKNKTIFGLDFRIFLLGLVSFLTDISSEMIFSVLSIFLVVILGASAFILGLMEGLADFASSSLDYISGYFSDKSGKRKKFAFLGYAFSTAAKVILVISNTIAGVFTFRVVERLGKSFRGPPKDAWISSMAVKSKLGYAFGFHKAMDKSGAIIGPFIAYFLIAYLGQTMSTFKLLFWIALVPAALSAIIILFVPDEVAKPQKRENIFTGYKTFSKDLKHYIKSASIFSLAYFSFGFLMLKAYLVGFEIKDVVLLYAIFNVAFVVMSIPIGRIGDKIGRKTIIVSEYIVYLIMSVGFIFATTKIEVIFLFVLFGIFYTIDEAQSKAYISDMETKRRATAIGFYNLITGIIYLPASLIAGYLWGINPNYAFGFAAACSIIAVIYFLSRKK